MIDEATETELKVQHSSILDPYILIVRDDSSCIVLQTDRKGELDEVEVGKTLKEGSWMSGCLHTSRDGSSSILAYLLGVDGNLTVRASNSFYTDT